MVTEDTDQRNNTVVAVRWGRGRGANRSTLTFTAPLLANLIRQKQPPG